MHDYDATELRRLSGADVSAVRSLARAGHIRPIKRAGRLRYSFRDLIIVRTARALRNAHVPPRALNRTLAEVRRSLPAGASLCTMSVSVLGRQVAVRDRGRAFEPASGQYLLDLEVVRTAGEVRLLATRTATEADGAAVHFHRALALEDVDAAGAIDAYRACLRRQAGHLEAVINLGRLLHAAGRLNEAEAAYRQTTTPDPLLAFNLAILLEDLDREAEAMRLYQAALALAPQFADAHFNLARLHDRAGRDRDALRHLLAYRRLLSDAGT